MNIDRRRLPAWPVVNCIAFVLLVVIGCRSATTVKSTGKIQIPDSAKASVTLAELFGDIPASTRPASTRPAGEQINQEAVLAFFQAKSLLLEKDVKGAVEALERSVSLDKTYLPAQSLLTKLYFDQGMVKDAETHARIILSLDPEEPTANYVLGCATLKGSDFKTASAHLYRAMRVWTHPDHEISLEGMLAAFRLAGALAGNGYFTAALEIYRPLLEQMDRGENDKTISDVRVKRMIQVYRPGIYLIVGELLLKLNRNTEALDYFGRGQTISAIKTQATIGTIRCFSRLRKTDEATKLLDALARSRGVDESILELYQELYPGRRWAVKVAEIYKAHPENSNLGVKIAENLRKSGNDELAGVVLKKILQVDPSNSQVFSLLIRVFDRAGKMEQAAKLLIDSVAASDTKTAAIPVAMKSIDATASRKLIRALVRLVIPADKEYARQFLLALSLQTAGQSQQAGEHFHSSLRLRNDFLAGYLAYGQLLLQDRKWKDAADLMEQALSRKLKAGGILYIQGCALMELNDIDKAIIALTEAKELNPDSDQVLLNLAECYLRSTDASKAFDLLKQIIGNGLAGPATMSRLVQMLLDADSASLAETVLQQYGERFGKDEEYRLLTAKMNFTRNPDASTYREELNRLRNSGFQSSSLDRELVELDFTLGNYGYVVQLANQILARNRLLTARDYQRIVEIQAFSYWRLLEYASAEQAWKRLLQTWPNHRMLRFAMARMYVDAQEYAKAVPLIETLLKQESNSTQIAQLQMWLIKCLMEQQGADRAITAIESWLPSAGKEDRARLLRMKVDCRLRQKQFTSAIGLLESYLTAKEAPVMQWQQLLISVLLDSGQADKAKVRIDEFLAGAGPERHFLEGLKVTVLLKLNKFDEAIALARQMAANAGKEHRYSSILILINSLQQAKRYDQAIGLIRQEIDKLPPDSSYIMGLRQQIVRTLELARRSEQAESFLLEQIAKAKPSVKNQWQQILVAMYFSWGKTDCAMKILEEILSSSPNLGWANNSLGYALADTGGNQRRAEVLIRKALATEPGSASYLDSLAWTLYRQERYDEAYRYGMMAYRGMDEADPVVLDHLGDICLKLGKRDEAKKFWQQAVDACQGRDPFTLEPGMPDRAEKKLKQIDLH